MKKIKILFILPKTQQGGAETQMFHILRNINKNRFDVYLGLLYQHDQLKDEFNRLQDIKIVDFAKKNKFDISIYFKIAKFANLNKIDIIQTFLGNHHSYLPALISQQTIAVGGIRGTQDKEFSSITKINEFVVPEKLTKLDKFDLISNSDAAKEIYIKKGFPQNRIHVIPNGIDAAFFSRGNGDKIKKEFSLSGKFVIGIVARLVKGKNHDIILRSIKKLQTKHPNLELIIVGDGPEQEHLEKMAEQLGIRDNVIFTGNRKDVKDILSVFDIFVFPSKSEGWPNVIGEAMAAGVPVLAYPAGDVAKIITNRYNGTICEPNEESFLKNLEKMISDNKLRKLLSKNAKVSVRKNFLIETMVNNYESTYTQILKMRRNETAK